MTLSSDPVRFSVPLVSQKMEMPQDKARRARARQRARRYSRYAVEACEGEISLPPFKPIGYLQQSQLIAAAQAGDIAAKQKIWDQNARLVFSVANKVRVRPCLVADAFQEGQFGIERAILRFDVSRLNEFSTYAYRAVLSRLVRYRHRRTAFISIPTHAYQPYHQFRTSVAEASTRSAWFDAREDWLSRDAEEYERLLRIHVLAHPVELAKDCKLAPDRDHPHARLRDAESLRDLEQCLGNLSPRHQTLLRRRYGIGQQAENTLEQIGQEIGLTKERIRQVQLQAEDQLRQALVKKGYDAFGWLTI